MECICEIIIYDINHIQTIYEVLKALKLSVRLSTPYASVAHAGADYYLRAYETVRQEYPEVVTQFVIDCGPYPGYAMACLRAGAKSIYVDIPEQLVLKALKSMAEKTNASIFNRSQHQLDMRTVQNRDQLIQWLLKLQISPASSQI